ncbi:MAG TPA: iron ABC transporter permease [Limnochordales bacterium]
MRSVASGVERAGPLSLRPTWATLRSGGRTASPVPLGLVMAALLTTAVLLIPPLYLVIRAAEGWQRSWQWLLHPRTWHLLHNSLVLAGAVTVTAVALALPLAWLLARTDLRHKRLWLVLLALPLAMPSYVGTFALQAAVQPGGVAAILLESLAGRVTLPRVEGFWGAWWVLTLFTYPYVLLPVRAAWSRFDPGLEEAARSLGVGRARRFWRVVLPQLWPSVTAGALVVAMYVLSDFGAVSLVRYDTLPLAIYAQYGGSFDRARAAVLALLLLLITVVLHRVERAVQRRQAVLFRAQPGVPRPPSPVRLGRWAGPATLACALVAVAAWGLPALSLLHWLSWGLVRGTSGVDHLRAVAQAAASSVYVAALAAAVAVAAAFPLAYLTTRFPGRLARAVEEAAYLSFGLPGIVVALALVFFGVRYLGPLYQTISLLVMAHTVHFMPQALAPQSAALARLNPHLEEVARSLGERPAGVLRRVVLPLLRPGVLAGASLVFLTSIKELPSTLLLSPTGFRTLAALTWMSAAEGFFARAALPGLVLLGVSAASVAIMLRHEQERWGHR